MVGVVAASVAGGGSYFLTGREAQKIQAIKLANAAAQEDDNENTEDDFWGNDYSQDDTINSPFGKVLKKLMNYNDFEVKQGTVSISSPSMLEPVKLGLKDTDVNLLDGSSPKVKGTIGVKYSGFDQEVTVAYQPNGKIFFDYLGGKVCYSVNPDNQSLLDIVNGLSELMASPSVPEAQNMSTAINFDELLAKVQTAFTNSDVSTDENGNYVLSINIGTLEVSGVRLSNLNLIVKADNQFNLSYLGTVSGAPITINDTIQIGLDLNLKMSVDNPSFVGYTEEEVNAYTSINPMTDSLLETIASYVNKKSFKAGIDFNLVSSDESFPEHNISMDILGDLSKVKSDASYGNYDVKIQDNLTIGGIPYTYDIGASYINSNLYLKVDDLFKGKLEKTTIDKLFEEVGSVINDSQIEEASESTSSTLDTVLNLIKNEDGQITIPSDIIDKSQGMVAIDSQLENSVSIRLNAQAMSLGDYYITVKLAYDKNLDVNSIEISGIEVGGFTLGAKISLEKMNSTNLTELEDAFSSSRVEILNGYKSYSAVVPIFDSVATMVKNKQFSLGYSVDVKTAASTSYSLSGVVEADMSTINTSPSLFADKRFGDYHLSANFLDTSTVDENGNEVGLHGYSQSIDAKYQDGSLYLVNNDEFKNTISNATFGKLFETVDSLLNSNSSSTSETIPTSASSDVLEAINSLVNGINNSSTFSNDFKTLVDHTTKGYFGDFNSFISIDKDNYDENKLVIELNIPYVFAQDSTLRNKLRGMTIEVNTSTSKLENIKVKGLAYDNNSLDMTLTVNDYADFKLTDTTGFTSLDHPISSFINLPTQLDKFGIDLSASLVNGSDTYTLGGKAQIETGIGDFNFDGKDVKGAGKMVLVQPDSITQKFEFAYNPVLGESGQYEDGETIAEYNDNMHIRMRNSTMVDVVKETSRLKENKLLMSLVGNLQTASDGLPILEVVKSQNYSLLVRDTIKSFVIDDSKLELQVYAKMFDKNASNEQVYTLGFTIDSTTDSITSAYIYASISGMDISATMNLVAYDEAKLEEYNSSVLAYSSEVASKFIDFEDISLLLKMGINTSELSHFNLTGKISLGVEAGASKDEEGNPKDKLLTINAYQLRFHAEIEIEEGAVKVYLALSNYNYTDPTIEGFYATEFFYSSSESEKDYIYVDRTKNAKGGVDNISSMSFKVTKDELMNNFSYYLLDITLNMREVLGTGVGGKAIGNIIMANVYKALDTTQAQESVSNQDVQNSEDSTLEAGVKITSDYSQIVDSTVGTSTGYLIDLDLSKLLTVEINNRTDLINLGHAKLNFTYGEGSNNANVITGISLTSRMTDENGNVSKEIVNIADVLSLNVSFHLDYHNNGNSSMNRFNEFMSYWDNQYSSLGCLEVTSIDYSSLLGILSDAKVNTNEKCVIVSGGSLTSPLYFKTSF